MQKIHIAFAVFGMMFIEFIYENNLLSYTFGLINIQEY